MLHGELGEVVENLSGMVGGFDLAVALGDFSVWPDQVGNSGRHIWNGEGPQSTVGFCECTLRIAKQ